jgi:mRNA interferase RelE/StbE
MERVSRRIDALAQQPRVGKTLKGGLRGKRSLRVGDYRIIYRLDTTQRQVIVENVGHRREIYT